MAEVIPTRMELIKTKERIVLAKKGYELLKKKRDALILEFFRILKKAQNLRSELVKKIGEAYNAVSLACLYHSASEIENVSLNLTKKIEFDIEIKNVMGVRIPSMQVEVEDRPLYETTTYSISGTSAKLDAAIESFNEVLKLTIALAETETALKRLIGEIEKTKRRVSALEYILIPRLEEQKRTISLRLDEMERDSFISLKTIKRKLEKERGGE
jgi:V/A-type H+-transporting ATPase subunit D